MARVLPVLLPLFCAMLKVFVALVEVVNCRVLLPGVTVIFLLFVEAILRSLLGQPYRFVMDISVEDCQAAAIPQVRVTCPPLVSFAVVVPPSWSGAFAERLSMVS